MRKTLTMWLALAVAAAAVVLASRVGGGESLPVGALARNTHFHGLAVDRGDPSRLYLATHHGLYRVETDGSAVRISEETHDFMGFTPHPEDPAVLYASGHPARGGNLGFIRSTDGGKTWRQLAEGVRGPVDFHSMDVSRADPRVIYGVYQGIQRSRDGGRSWSMVGPAPEGLIDIAASALDPKRLYAATRTGLLYSEDGGRRWRAAGLGRAPVSLAYAGGDGHLYAYVVNRGLHQSREPDLRWARLSDDFDGRYLLHLALDPTDPARLYAIRHDAETRRADLVASHDGGATWAPLSTRQSNPEE